MATTKAVDRQDIAVQLLLAIFGVVLAAIGWWRWLF
jgi:hypothetical protein